MFSAPLRQPKTPYVQNVFRSALMSWLRDCVWWKRLPDWTHDEPIPLDACLEESRSWYQTASAIAEGLDTEQDEWLDESL